MDNTNSDIHENQQGVIAIDEYVIMDFIHRTNFPIETKYLLEEWLHESHYLGDDPPTKLFNIMTSDLNGVTLQELGYEDIPKPHRFMIDKDDTEVSYEKAVIMYRLAKILSPDGRVMDYDIYTTTYTPFIFNDEVSVEVCEYFSKSKLHSDKEAEILALLNKMILYFLLLPVRAFRLYDTNHPDNGPVYLMLKRLGSDVYRGITYIGACNV